MKALQAILAALAALAAYLLLWPTGMEPVAWTPPPAPPLEGVYAYNETLKGIQKLAAGVGVGPESVNVDAVGRVYAGYADGRIVMLASNGASWTEMANTHGRPLGLTFGPFGGLVIADARKGLLHLGNKVRPLVSEAEGGPLRYANDADNTRMDKNIYFTDSSAKFGGGHYLRDLLEHGANGRLLQYNVATKQAHVLLKGLHFPNGVAVGPDDAYVLVSETAEYRVLRYWLKGPQAGSHDVFIDNLPGFPDNLSYNNRDRFWLALSPREARLDELLPDHLWLRGVLGRLPQALFPRERHHAIVLGLGLDGSVVSNLQYKGDDAYAPISSVREHGPWLYFGSPSYAAIGRLPLNQAVPGSREPPPGWEQLPPPQALPKQRTREDLEEEEEERRREKGGDPDEQD